MNFLSREGEYLGSHFEIKLPEENISLCDECFAELKRIEQEYSRFLDTSELSKINSKLGIWHDISPEFVSLVKKALEFNKLTNGNFDITLKSSLDSLGYDKNYSFSKKSEIREHLISRIKNKIQNKLNPVVLDEKHNKILLRKEIELGGFGKGYCLDRLSKILESKSVTNYYINGGGDIYAKKEDENDSWTVLLEHPDDSERAIGQINLNGMAIAGSAPNRRKWGKYHHLLNSKTKLPQDSVKCIFVLAKTGIEADAHATSLFTAGFDEGIKLANKLSIDILIVSKEDKMYISPGFKVELFS
jgi:thiamine biosynthesis lipoprotein